MSEAEYKSGFQQRTEQRMDVGLLCTLDDNLPAYNFIIKIQQLQVVVVIPNFNTDPYFKELFDKTTTVEICLNGIEYRLRRMCHAKL